MTHHRTDYDVGQSVCQGAGPSLPKGTGSVFIVLSLLLAVACVVPAIAKMQSHPKMVASASHFDIPWALAGLTWGPMGIAAAAGMAVLLIGALTVHRRTGDGIKEAAPAILALGISLAYLVTALTR